jgi:hypothetical protein
MLAMQPQMSSRILVLLTAVALFVGCAAVPPEPRDRGNATVSALRSLQPFASGTGAAGAAGAALLGAGAAGAAGSRGLERGAVGIGTQGVGAEFVGATVWEVTVALDSGGERVLRMDRAPPFGLGARVQVDGERIEPAR